VPSLRVAFIVVAAGLFFARPTLAANACVTASSDAQDLRAANRLREARAALLVCSAATCNPVVRSNCEKWLAEVEEKQPTVIVRALDRAGREAAGARSTIDDRPVELDGKAVAVDPGWHVLRATLGENVAEAKILVALGEKGRVLEIRLSPRPTSEASFREEPAAPPPPRPAPPDAARPHRDLTLPLALGGVGIVALGSFVLFEIVGHSNYADLERGCFVTKTCTNADEDPVKAQFVVAGVSVAVAAVALTAAAIVYFTGDRPSANAVRRAPARRPSVLLGGITF
jgi:hypothetical protein